ncbi:transposable element Tcb2 transposase [Trichonephila clavipes]|nr:transposable element Tcb2 transposase [Trichonephila clavipes]
MSFTRKPSSGRPRQTSRREHRHIVRNARVQPTASSAAIQVQVAPSHLCLLHTGRLAGRHLGSRRPLRVLPVTPTHRSFGVVPRSRKLNCSGMEPAGL